MTVIPYALIGIPIAAILFQTIGKILSEHQKTILRAFERRVLKRQGTIKHQAAKASAMTLNASFMFFLCGAGHYRYLHGPNTFLDGLYAWFMTLTTVGFGDLVPAQPGMDNPFNILQPIAIILGLCAVSTAFNNISDCFKEGYFNINIFSCSCCWEKAGIGKVGVKECQSDTAKEEDQTVTNRSMSASVAQIPLR